MVGLACGRFHFSIHQATVGPLLSQLSSSTPFPFNSRHSFASHFLDKFVLIHEHSFRPSTTLFQRRQASLIESILQLLPAVLVLAPMADPEKWQCHECGSGPHLYATTKRCTGVVEGRQCGHKVCDDCKKDNNIQPPLASKWRTRSSDHQHGDVPIRDFTALHSGYDHERSVNAMCGGGRRMNLRLTSRPSMAGWWKCCQCRNWNNPTLSPERCVQCQHRKCSYCTLGRR